MIRPIRLGLAAVLTCGVAINLAGQSKPPASTADYGQWETLAMPPRAGLSPDGRWLAYGINRSNRDNELRIANVGDATVKTIAFGTQPLFSADSRWVAYSIGQSEAQEEKLRKQKKPVQRKLGLLNLASGEMITIDGVESFSFDASGTHLAMKRYAPERPNAPPQPEASEAEPPPGVTLLVRQLATGRDTTFGNVSEYAWQDKGPLLAIAISAEDKAGNGIQLLDPGTGTLRVLDSSSATYSGLTWRKEADDLAALRSKKDDDREGPTHVALAWGQLASASPRNFVFDPTASAGFPAGMRTVAFRGPSWSEDGRIVFLGVAKWEKKLGPAQPESADATADTNKDKDEVEEESASVDVWHARDVDVMPKQRLSARTDRQRNMLAAWHVEDGRFVQLGKDLLERIVPLKYQTLAYAVNWRPYAMDRSIGRGAADVYLIDLSTGERTRVAERIDDRYLQASPAGRYLLYLQGDQYWTVDTATRAVTSITKSAATTFVDRESDATVKQKPPFGVAGWTKDDESVVIYDKFDLWQAAGNGSSIRRLTEGAADQVRHRYVRLNPDEDSIDLERPVHVSLFAIWTKRTGYGTLQASSRHMERPVGSTVERLVWIDKAVDRLGRAKDADVYAYVQQAFDDSPDVFVAGAGLKAARQLTSTNPFQQRFAWGRSELVEYKGERGDRLQGALFYPAGYEPGKKYPMVVYLYERLSDGLHRYSSPSEREPYNASVFTSQGYLFFQPDIVFRPREPGLSVVECVGPAVKKVVAMGVADPARVGVVGHSWGGFDTVFLATHTNLFAAAVAGAPITDLVSNYGSHHWSSGIAETDHIETGQQRMEVPLWEDLNAYIRNSAVFGVQTMKTPLVVAFGDNDGTVHWHQGVELYNIARRANKDVVLLVYAGEDHGLRKKPNQMDYHHRVVEWFGHYLKNEPAPGWITNGVSFLEREQELKRVKAVTTAKPKTGT